MQIKKIRFVVLPLLTTILAACGDGSSNGSSKEPNIVTCIETGTFACQTGTTEPLYPFQWAHNYKDSYFKDFPDTFSDGLDLNVEPVHRQGYKGQGVNVLVLDSGTDLGNEDLSPNADSNLSWNLITQTNDPFPHDPSSRSAPHGTAVAGIIAAAQNNKGVMGIAPLVNLGAANYIEGQHEENAIYLSYGGAPWSSKAHVLNASYGYDGAARPYESDTSGDETIAIRGIKRLRDGKGGVFVKAAGNSFDPGLCGTTVDYFDCTNPANDPVTLESNVITVAALNAKGSASSYSSAGSVVWITGMGGEYGGSGNYGEGAGRRGVDGPTVFSTDISGCINGYSHTGAETPFLRGQTERNGEPDNRNCDYTYMNGTSSAAPTISGVVALMLSANPALTWRDVRDILLASARQVDLDYIYHIPLGGDKPFGALSDLSTNQPTDQIGSAASIYDGARSFPMNLGWQKNAAGHDYSDWYGFGVPDTERAVALALDYAKNPGLSRSEDVQMSDFKPLAYWRLNPVTEPDPDLENVPVRVGAFPYQKISSAGVFTSGSLTVDQFQVRLSGEDVCLGSLGVAVKSPSGTVSLLKLPDDHFKANGNNEFSSYGLGSFAFYGESAQGNWEVFMIASNPDTQIDVYEIIGNKPVTRKSEICSSTDSNGAPADFQLLVEARIIGQ